MNVLFQKPFRDDGLLKPPASDAQKDRTVLQLALIMFMAPALGVPSEEVLQDTFKSAIISLGALGACLTYFWHQRKQSTEVIWHPLMWLPLGLSLYALGSMVWSHTYLGGVEAVRWFVFSLLLWLGMNTLTYDRVPRLALGIHLGATVASIWAALQFWIDFKYFPQGPNPASTFVNRNFFAEFAVCTLPFSLYLLTREKQNGRIVALSLSIALNLAALMMTGTRSALIGIVMLVVVLPIIMFLYWDQLETSKWSAGNRLAVPVLLVTALLGAGLIPSINGQLITEYGGGTALERAFSRSVSMSKSTEYTEGSFFVRALMWKATGRMIEAQPWTGVGAGAWEVHAPLYQNPGTQLETDLYAHNEILQLLAEYGLVGWAFLLCLIGYLALAALKTWTNRSAEGRHEAPLRAFTLASLLVFLLVSNAGFAWRLASTGAMFALSLSILAASDARLSRLTQQDKWRVVWRKSYTPWALCLTAFFMVIAAYITQQAIESESKLIRAIRSALTISKSEQPNHPLWNKAKADILDLTREGIAINPHYRKLTPMVADELANWGDSANAIWIWESVLASRPNVVVIATNISRGYLQIGNYQRAMDYFDRAAKLQPTAPAVRSLQAHLLIQRGEYPQAAEIVRELLQANTIDNDVVNSAYLIGVRTQDWELAILALELRIKKWPNKAVGGWLRLGNIYSSADVNNEAKALESYRAALNTAPDDLKDGVLAKVPQVYRAKLQEALQ
nr:O-antigen ligase family protein [Rhodoferax sp.]